MISGKKKKTFKTGVCILSFLFPAFLFYTVFIIFPIFDTANISMTDWNGMTVDYDYVGLSNYVSLFHEKIFINSVINTLVWLLIQLVIIVFPTMVLALAITKVKKGMTFFRAGFYLPSVISFSVASVIWGKIYDPTMGPINIILKGIGLGAIAKNWLGDPHTVLPALAVASSWVQYGLYMVLFITGLQGIDPQYYEAAELDGANAVQKFWKITVPSLSNTVNVVISMVIINAFKSFGMVWATTQGGPFYKSDLISTYIYREAFTGYKLGTGGAGGIMLAAIIMLITIAFNTYREWRASR